jgi:hypothetical protein
MQVFTQHSTCPACIAAPLISRNNVDAQPVRLGIHIIG